MDKKLLGQYRCGVGGHITQEQLTFKPGGCSPKHYHNQTHETYMVISGEGEILYHNQHIKVSAGFFISISMHNVHQIINTGNVDLVIMSTKNQSAEFADFHEVA